MIDKLDQKTKYAKSKVFEIWKFDLQESIVIVPHFDGTSRLWVQSLA